MTEIVVASGNRGKIAELAHTLAPLGVTLRPQGELGAPEVEETGLSFVENAILKARAAAAHTGLPAIADDSGLAVDALGGAPGIYSARFGSPDGGKTELEASARNQLLIAALEAAKTRTAHFVCSMVALLENDRIIVAQESWMGEISEAPSAGTGGFGYDPVFFVPGLGKTAADLSPEEKNRFSHRGRASRVLAAALNEAASLPR